MLLSLSCVFLRHGAAEICLEEHHFSLNCLTAAFLSPDSCHGVSRTALTGSIMLKSAAGNKS
jgi:hypothetical protein